MGAVPTPETSEPLTLHGANLRIQGLTDACKVELAHYISGWHWGSFSYSSTSARRRWVVNITPRPLYPRERDPVPLVEEAG